MDHIRAIIGGIFIGVGAIVNFLGGVSWVWVIYYSLKNDIGFWTFMGLVILSGAICFIVGYILVFIGALITGD